MARTRRLSAIAIACILALLVLAPHGAAQGGFVREVVASGLDWPVSLAFLSQAAHGYPAGAIFYTERFTGDIRVLIDRQPRPLRVANVPVETSGEQGLLGLALDPDFLSSPWIYAYHTYFNGTLGRDVNRVVRFWLGLQVPAGPPRMEVVLDGIPAASVHNGGIIGFAPDGT
ncbi:MAG TPA: PQQ-dependent sugar dehydrogenase, partial [Thermoplasmata archaeon]|nr:PQQ-dependent sugar dehydrogenase [Thermoplasmata archaeon]